MKYLVENGADIDTADRFVGGQDGPWRICYLRINSSTCLFAPEMSHLWKSDARFLLWVITAAQFSFNHLVLLCLWPMDDLLYQGRNILSYSAEYGDVDIVKYLTEEIDEIDKADQVVGEHLCAIRITFLIWAATIFFTFVSLVLMSGSMTLIKQGRTPLSYAAQCGHLDIVKYLIEKGVDIDKADRQVGG